MIGEAAQEKSICCVTAIDDRREKAKGYVYQKMVCSPSYCNKLNNGSIDLTVFATS